MFLPTKGISAERALVSVGADVLSVLDAPITVSGLWLKTEALVEAKVVRAVITFDWFALALAALFAIGAIESTPEGLIRTANVSP